MLSDPPASLLLRIARRELVSLRAELRVLLYAGAALVASGAGLLVKDHYARIGPAGVAVLLALVSAACFAYVLRRAPPFTFLKSESPTLAFDYVLLLGLLVLGSDLAFLEAQFELLGGDWPYHLLLAALVYLAAAYRFDSQSALSLGLGAFAAWLGLSMKPWLAFETRGGDLRVRAVLCGVLFAAIGALFVRMGKKAHFETVWVTAGLFLAFGGLVSGAVGGEGWVAWESLLVAASLAVLAAAFLLRRSLYFAIALVALEIAFLRWAAEWVGSFLAMTLLVALSSAAVLVVVMTGHRRMREEV